MKKNKKKFLKPKKPNGGIIYNENSYDLIIANINKNVILELLPNIHKHKKNKNKIILSGLLIDDENDINRIVTKLNFKIINTCKMGEWLCFVIE